MKHLAILTALLLFGCAQTALYDRQTGKAIARWQSNVQKGSYTDGATKFSWVGMDNSTPTTAGGNAFATGAQAAGAAGAGLLIAGGIGNAATTTQTVVRSTAAASTVVVPQKAAKAPATPAPTPEQIWPTQP